MSENKRLKNSTYNLLTGILGQLVQTILKFLVRTIFISTLGREYLGINGLFSDILTLLSITELGLDTAINTRLYKPLATKDEKRVRLLVKFFRNMYFVVGVVIIMLGCSLIPFLPSMIKNYDTLPALGINVVLIYCLYLFQSASSYLFLAYKSCVIKADQKSYVLEVAQIVVAVISNICQIAILLVFRNFQIYTLVLIFFTVISNLVNAVIAQKMYPGFFVRESESISKDEAKDIFKDCGALFIYKVNGVVTRATDNLILSKFIGIVIVGMYSNYLLLYNTLNRFLNRFYESCKASMGNVYAVSDITKSYRLFETMNLLTFILYGTACTGIATVSNELINLWLGPDYVLEQPIPILLGIALVFSGIRNNLGQIRNISGAFRQMWYRPLLGIVINLAVSIILVNYWGISGVLLGTIVSNLFTNFMMDPVIIYKYSFNGIKPVSRYYFINISYFIVLSILIITNFSVCSLIQFESNLLSFIFHTLICGISVPLVYLLLFGKTEAGRYLIQKLISIIKRRI